MQLLSFFLVMSMIFNIIFYFSLLGYTLNVSPSIPLGIYKMEAITKELQEGDLVEVQIPEDLLEIMKERGYKAKTKNQIVKTFLKYIRGTPGDEIILETTKLKLGKTITKNGEVLGIALYRDTYGQSFSLPDRFIVQKGEYFIMGEHYKSYDSRYFGPVDGIYITRKAIPIWTW